jgi:hypothetical protein
VEEIFVPEMLFLLRRRSLSKKLAQRFWKEVSPIKLDETRSTVTFRHFESIKHGTKSLAKRLVSGAHQQSL